MEPLGVGDPIRLGPYRILGVLGEGGMGKVYFGRDNGGRTAAVKVLLPELAHDTHLVQRFLREAHTAQSVTSGGVARVLNAQTEDNRPWIATEFLSGPTLDDAVRGHGPFGPDAVRALAASLAATLKDIHAAGLIHRDLKPANIVLTSTGPRVIDFGIARPEHGLTLTTTGQVPVTPGYGAPEQVLGQRVGPTADVFSLGAVLAYAATGRRAFDGAHVAAVQYEVVHGEAQLAAVPDDLRLLIAPCLAKDPAHRPTPDQIQGAFAPPRGADRVWRTGPIAKEITRRGAEADRQATLVGPDPAAGPSRRRLLRTSLAAGGVLAAGGGAGAWWLLSGKEPPVPNVQGLAVGAKLLPLSAGQSGKAPEPLWGPLPVAAKPVRGTTLTPLSVRDVVIFASKDGGLAAHLTRDGREKWRLPDVAAGAGLMSLTDQLFVAADVKGALQVHDGSTGKLVWSIPDAEVSRFLTMDKEKLYFVTLGGQLRAVEIKLQLIRWSAPLPAGALRDAGPLAAVGALCIVLSGGDGGVYAFYTQDGSDTWTLKGQSSSAIQPLVVERTTPKTRDYVFYLGGRSLTARTWTGGDELWTVPATEVPQQDAGGWGAPMLQGTSLIAMNGTKLSSYDLDGKPLPLSGSAVRGPLPHNPLVLQGSTLWAVEGGGKGVSALSVADGKRFWTWSAGSSGPWALSGAGNRVFLVNDGKLTAMPTIG